MRMVEYQRVQHALPNGVPDLQAPDNFWIRTDTTWYLMLDSEAVVPDASGTKHLHRPEFRYASYVRYAQEGRAPGKLADRFTELWGDRNKLLKTGSGSIGENDEEVPLGTPRRMTLYARTLVERVEVHSEGKRRVTRKQREALWSLNGEGTYRKGPYMPEPHSTLGADADPHVRVDPVTYGYGPFKLPKDDDI